MGTKETLLRGCGLSGLFSFVTDSGRNTPYQVSSSVFSQIVPYLLTTYVESLLLLSHLLLSSLLDSQEAGARLA